ncbi:ectonucleoside triphosphate diphosphohydrolase 6 isoform X2 [Salvelinus sp. IW2-2015]|uniref:ectonucleoside triphosphate diphosphohydrolase 6 isoform X2 n=1 Tax=Salvelinus sp. IW2-2015 TaxID=2691554 RepID=UPI000CDFF0B6|nr:ectonucleoside triphosphate diphosphohydrolase 6 isoform X2 [Salvelinus alpinus]
MRLPKIASVFVFLGCLAAYLIFVTHHYDGVRPAISKIPPHFHPRLGLSGSPNRPTSSEVVSGRSQYGVMFDAGSTGTRIHVFKFQLEDNEAPKLAHETFRAIKPGLSAYADDPEKCKEGILELLEVAQDSIPSSVWSSTPLVLKATAGLRLLPGEKATHLLDRVREVFVESPFLSRGDSVSIMDGADEGISAWITVNFLIGGLHSSDTPTVGMLDLGGGSTQITFSPQDEKTIQTSPIDYMASFQMFNSTHTLYSHSRGQQHRASKSLLGPGLLWPMGTRRSSVYCEGPESSFVSVSGVPIYESCLRKVEKVLYRKVKKAEEAKDIEFYAFSYYYDRAVDLGAIDEKTGGIIKVSDYIDTAKRVCNGMTVTPRENPFLCLDLTYISTMLQELGFPKEKVFKLVRKIDEVETSWALGATFHYIESLHSQ